MENISSILKKYDILTKKWMDTVDYHNGTYWQSPEMRSIENQINKNRDYLQICVNFLSKKEKYNLFLKLKKIIDKNNVLKLSDSELTEYFWWDYKNFKNNPQDYKPANSSTNITLEDIVRSLEKFDWSYEMSDDNKIWTAGKAKRAEIGKMIEEFLEAYPNQKMNLFSTLKKVFTKNGRKSFFEPSDFSPMLRKL